MKQRAAKAIRKVVRLLAPGALVLAALSGAALPARAASSAQLNIGVSIQGISNIVDLNAVPGGSAGSISLSWTEPYHFAGTPPYSYDVRISSLAQISDDVVFSTSALLSAFSSSTPPLPGAGGGAAGFVVNGLAPGVTYYFAIREKDSVSVQGSWVRTLSPARNVNNFATATYGAPAAPASGVVSAVYQSSAAASWSASGGATNYYLVAATSSALAPVTASSSTAATSAVLTGLSPNTTYFFGAAACAAGCSAFTSFGSTITLAAPAVSLSTTGVSSGTIALVWGANGNPAGTLYLIRTSTDAVTYATNATATATTGAASGLSGGATYYVQVVAVNGAGVQASPSNVLTVVTPTGPVPATPTGLAASAGVLSVSLRWDPLPSNQQGQGLLYYSVFRSTNASFGYVRVATTTGTSLTNRPLASGVTYYFEVGARDVALADGIPSAPVAATPFTLRPMEPIGVSIHPSSSSVSISWSPTARFFDGTPFLSTGTPTVDELIGYSVYRSTSVCNPYYALVSSLPTTSNAIVDNTGGLNYFYRLFAYNSLGTSADVVALSSLGDRHYSTDDCETSLVLDDQTAATLNGANNGVGDIRLYGWRRPQDVGGGTYQSAEFHAYLNGASELKNYVLPKPVRVTLRFDMLNGKPVPSTAAVNGLGALSAVAPTAGGSASDLGMYWYNGAEFKKMYGRVDTLGQTVSVDSPNLGIYQIRALARAAGAVFDLSNLSSRVITPNGDGVNDTVIFTYDPGPNGVQAEGKIYDLRGAFVADMVSGLVPNTLVWDGHMGGRPATSGVYVYRVSGDGKTFTGTIVVAR